ncbi:conserved hypothetical protein [Culex quinquefasciatus]|uniref:Uncharacterized protein n=1 Tax=Culex quinquefasciatus TaxID=7176 RepID=B0W734_CULQU|nr:conserved hypothetical protein [Culex quinquefasciatus]|eukprot:XP_001844518.1 conserved hypothetical protein [Culex quinquefasciatus]
MPEGDNIQPDGNLLYERLLQQNERLEAQNARMMEMLERFNLQDASGKSLSLLGELRCQVTLGGVTRTGTFYVTDKQINLFGLDWIELFELWDTGKVNRVKQQRSLAVKSQGEANTKTGLGPTDAVFSPSESTAWHEEHLRWYCSQYLTA